MNNALFFILFIIIIGFGYWLRGKILTFFRGYDTGQIKELRKKIENYEYLTQEEFDLWKKHCGIPSIHSTYEAYMQEYKKTPQQREDESKAFEEILFKTSAGQKLLELAKKELGLDLEAIAKKKNKEKRVDEKNE